MTIFRLGSMSVEDINTPNKSPGAKIPFGSLGIHMQRVDGYDDVVKLARNDPPVLEKGGSIT